MPTRAPGDLERHVGFSDDEFMSLVDRHTKFILNVARQIMDSADDVEDVAQDALISAYRARDRFRGDAKPTTWLYRITVNSGLMRIRKDKRRIQATAPENSYEEHNITDWGHTPENAALNAELGREILSRIAVLPEDLRTAVVLRDVRNLSNGEAAELAGISLSALKARLHRGRLLLRSQLTDYVGPCDASMVRTTQATRR